MATIILDCFSGHLFHDLEMFIIAFGKKIKFGGNPHRFINDTNKFLVKKLFNSDIEFGEEGDEIIDRRKIDHGNINKAFATYIESFDYQKWSASWSYLDKPTKNTLLYVTRQNTSRKLSDESHQYIESLVRGLGGIVCDAGTLDIEKQIELFRNSCCVIGVHGNNLSGIMWMTPGSHVFEILPFDGKRNMYDYHCMSLCMRHNYTQLDCEESPWSLGPRTRTFLESTLHLIMSIKNEYSCEKVNKE
jgi:hypothetical protein